MLKESYISFIFTSCSVPLSTTYVRHSESFGFSSREIQGSALSGCMKSSVIGITLYGMKPHTRILTYLACPENPNLNWTLYGN